MSAALLFDCAILGIAAVSGLLGIASGLVRELFGLLAVLVGVFVSTKYADAVGQLLVQYGLKTDNHTLLTISGFMILLIIIWSAFIIVGKLISKALKLSGLGLFDRIFGFIFGAGKFLIVASVVAACVNSVPFLDKYANDQLSSSQAWPLLKEGGKLIANTDLLEYKNHLQGQSKSKTGHSEQEQEQENPSISKENLTPEPQQEQGKKLAQ